MAILAQPLRKFNGRNKTEGSESFQEFPDIYADVGFVFVNTFIDVYIYSVPCRQSSVFIFATNFQNTLSLLGYNTGS